MDVEERLRKLEETTTTLTEAIRFRSEMDMRSDADLERLRQESERGQDRLHQEIERQLSNGKAERLREHTAMREERATMHADHEQRLRKLEHVAWATLGTASVSFVTALAAVLVKALH